MLPVRVKQMQRRRGDPAILVANAGKARELLGWEPRFSDLETIVSTAWHWETNWRSMQQAAAG
jgi:UDP-glucose 4-epimerase